MPCYIQRVRPPSRAEFELWQKMGYTGSWDDYRTTRAGDVGRTMFLCGEFGPHCVDCAAVGDFLCDYPVGDGKTCDRPMCDDHAHEIAPEIHYCDAHYRMWTEFRERGGVDEALRNVVAFPYEK